MTLMIAAAGDDDATRLVALLGSPRFSERESAERRLLRLDREAIPLLESALENPDPEVRSRASGLIAKIELNSLGKPTLVSLNCRDETLENVLKELSRISRQRIVVEGLRAGDPLLSRRISLATPESTALWDVLESVRKEAGLAFISWDTAWGSGRIDELNRPSIAFAVREGKPNPYPTIHSGLFRIAVSEVDVEGNFVVAFEPEPRVIAVQDGPLSLRKAESESGRDLIRADNPEPEHWTADDLGEMFGEDGAPSSLRKFVGGRLQPARGAAGKVRTLRGVIPLAIIARQPEPIEVSLRGAAPRQAHNGSIAVTAYPSRGGTLAANGVYQDQIEFRVRAIGAEPLRPRLLAHEVEIIDGLGRRFRTTSVSCSQQFRRGRFPNARFDFTSEPDPDHPHAGPEERAPAKLLLYKVLETKIELRFDFQDVPTAAAGPAPNAGKKPRL